jgi:nucleotide-binding universal stress UspA family protein
MPVQIMVAVHNGYQTTGPAELALNWAKRLGGAVVGLGLIDESIWAPAPVTLGTPVVDPGVERSHVDAKRSRAEQYVEESLQSLADRCHSEAVPYRQIDKHGAPAEEIVTEGQRFDVILLGKQTAPDPGLGAPSRTILNDVLRHTPRPVVTAPDGLGDQRGILVAYDGSLQAARAVEALVASGLTGLDGVEVLTVDSDSEDAARERAHRAAEYLAAHDVDVKVWCEVSEEPVERVILDKAAEKNVELIVMGAYGKSRLAEFVMGSTTTRVIDRSSVPLLLFH